MTTQTLIEQARADGLELHPNGDKLKLRGTPEAIEKWRPLLAPHKGEILAALSSKLSADFRLVSTWWAWSLDDIEHFRAWAKLHREEAAQWIHQEADVCRHRRDNLHINGINEFITPAICNTTTR
jgi:hypothetical protein